MKQLDVHFDDGSVVTLVPKPPAPPAVQYYMIAEDKVALGGVRGCAPCPAVMVLKDDPHAIMNQQWQYFIRAINYNMTLDNAYLLLDRHLAFANNIGFGRIGAPDRKDYFHNLLNYDKFPQLDKVRSCSRSVVTGVEAYSLMEALKNTARAVQARTATKGQGFAVIRQALTSQNVLKVKVFDSRQPPPLKPGRSYPTDISKVNPDDYAVMPETSPEMFLVATVVRADGTVYQFPRGGLYPWFLDGKTPASFMPHVANLAYGDVQYPLSKLHKLPLGSVPPSPYRY